MINDLLLIQASLDPGQRKLVDLSCFFQNDVLQPITAFGYKGQSRAEVHSVIICRLLCSKFTFSLNNL